MKPFFETLPSTIDVGGREFSIFTDFRDWLRFEALVRDTSEDATDDNKLMAMLDWFEDEYDLPESLEEAIAALLLFFRCGRPIAEKRSTVAKSKDAVPYDTEKCIPLIYSAFLQSYGIDLVEAELHWWAYCALLEGLPANTRFSDILLMCAAPTSKENKEQKAYREEIRAMYGQNTTTSVRGRSLEERDNEILDRAKRAKRKRSLTSDSKS